MNNNTSAAALTLGTVVYTVKDYEAAYLFFKQNLDAQLQASGMSPADMLVDEEKKQAYHGMISNEALQQLLLAATLENILREEGLTLDAKALDTMLADSGTALGGAEAFDAMLSQLHMDRDQLKKLMLAPELMVQQLRETYAVSRADELRAMFESKYLRAKHILLKEDAGTSSREAEARELAEQARNGADFDALIAQHGEDPGMAANATGYVFPEGQMVQEFYEGTLALELNAISDPVRTSYGWHIIQRLPLDEEIYQAHTQELQQDFIGVTLDSWLAHHQPVMNPDVQEITAETILGAN